MKSVIKVKYYIRYCDDIVVLSSNKDNLRNILLKMREYLEGKLNLAIKSNYQIFPVDSRGIDFLGYVNRHGVTRVRKSIKAKSLRRLSRSKSSKRTQELIASIGGWITHCDEVPVINLSKVIKNKQLYDYMSNLGESKKNDKFYEDLSGSQASGLSRKILNLSSVKKFSELGIKQEPRKRMILAKKVSTNDIINLPIIITDVVENIDTGKFNSSSDDKPISKTAVEFVYENDETCTKYKFITSAYLLVDALSKIKDSLPVLVTIRKSADPSNPIRSYLRFE